MNDAAGPRRNRRTHFDYEYARVPRYAIPKDAVWHLPERFEGSGKAVSYSHGSPGQGPGTIADSGALYARETDPVTGRQTYYRLAFLDGQPVADLTEEHVQRIQRPSEVPR